MEVSGKLQTMAPLFLGKGHPVPTEQQAGWSSRVSLEISPETEPQDVQSADWSLYQLSHPRSALD
jgi:hypothetical protein